MRPAEIRSWRILADFDNAFPDRARARKMLEQCVAIAFANCLC